MDAEDRARPGPDGRLDRRRVEQPALVDVGDDRVMPAPTTACQVAR
jgi:hypothetical protein